MLARLLLPLALLLTPGCAEAYDTATRARDCAALAREVAAVGLNGVPTQAEAEQAAQRLDEQVQGLADSPVKDAATDLRDGLRRLSEAARTGGGPQVQQAVEEVRRAAGQTAQACRIPVEQFLR